MVVTPSLACDFKPLSINGNNILSHVYAIKCVNICALLVMNMNLRQLISLVVAERDVQIVVQYWLVIIIGNQGCY